MTSWSDRELCSGERILLPKREDLTVLSFRCAQDQSAPALLVTDKFGSVAERVELEPEQASLMLEFSLRLRTWFLFKVDVGRVYEMKRYETRADKLEDAFLTLLPALQSGGETALERFALTDEAISVAL